MGEVSAWRLAPVALALRRQLLRDHGDVRASCESLPPHAARAAPHEGDGLLLAAAGLWGGTPEVPHVLVEGRLPAQDSAMAVLEMERKRLLEARLVINHIGARPRQVDERVLRRVARAQDRYLTLVVGSSGGTSPLGGTAALLTG